MENLQSKYSITGFSLSHSLLRIVDLINIEGPLLTLYKNKKNGKSYLFDWVDSDASYNRWLIYSCNIHLLQEFVQQKISHLNLFSAQNTYYKIDIDENINWTNFQVIEKKDLPKSYFPEKDIFFEADFCSDFKKLNRVIKQAKQKITTFPSKKEDLMTSIPFTVSLNQNRLKKASSKKIIA